MHPKLLLKVFPVVLLMVVPIVGMGGVTHCSKIQISLSDRPPPKP
jgi:hypothetical protein